CHLANIELIAPYHAAEAVDEDRNLHEVEREGPRPHGAFRKGLVVVLGAGDGFEFKFSHGGAYEGVFRASIASAGTCVVFGNMERTGGISAAADVLGVSISTLRRWEAQAGDRTSGGRSSPLRSRQAAPSANGGEISL